MSLRLRKARRSRRKPEPTIALINIVFLMLVFFLVAGTLAQPIDTELTLVDTAALEGAEPPDALVITATGDLRFRGTDVETPQAYFDALAPDAPARLLPDRAAPAGRLVSVAQHLRALGVEEVLIVTQRNLKEATP